MLGWIMFRGQRFGTLVLFGSVAAVWIIMALLGLFFVNQLREAAMQNAAAAGSLYVEGFLSPHARRFLAETSLPIESAEELKLALRQPLVLGKIVAFKLWNLEGKLVFSSEGAIEHEDEFPEDLKKAIAGDVVVELYPEGAVEENTLIGQPLLEVHAPIYDAASNKVIAVGEIYESADRFLSHRTQTERLIWLAVGFAAIGLTGLFLHLAAQRTELMKSLAVTRATAGQNQLLKESADLARIHASQSNEELLNRLGAELHDGPIQMLSLIMLMQGKDAFKRPLRGGLSERELTEHTMADLRAISSGLILPEIAELTLEDALRLGVTRHEEVTGLPVKLTLTDLPATVDPALKICCYRLIQEGLTNAGKHGGGAATEVSVRSKDGWLIAEIHNDGAEDGSETPITGRSGGLGLQGLRTRISVFGGDVALIRHPAGGADLIARIPIDTKRSWPGLSDKV